MSTLFDQLTRPRNTMMAARDLRTLPADGNGWVIVGAAGTRAHIIAVHVQPNVKPGRAPVVVVLAVLRQINGWPFPVSGHAARERAFHAFTGVVDVDADPLAGTWLLTFPANSDPLSVAAPPVRRDWSATLHTCAHVARVAAVVAASTLLI